MWRIAHAQGRASEVVAQTYRGMKWASASQPRLLSCDDGRDYVVKGRQLGRVVVNEHVVGRLGAALGAPVGRVVLVHVPLALISLEPELAHMPPGVAHGSEWVSGCSDRLWIDHIDEPANRPRFASLAVLYGWIPAGDQQLIYSNAAPHVVYSVDHGHYVPGGPNWTVAQLQGAGLPVLHPDLATGCNLDRTDVLDALTRLRGIDDQQIADVIAGPPNEWGFTTDERVETAMYLAHVRRIMAPRTGSRA
jgi:hypothetical protein